LESHGISPSDPNAIAILPPSENSTIEAEYLGPNSNGAVTMYAVSTFVIVFKTMTNEGTGFRLRFQSSSLVATKVPGELLVFSEGTNIPLELPLATVGRQWNPIVVTSGFRMLEEPNRLKISIWQDFPAPEFCLDKFAVHSFDGQDTKWEELLVDILFVDYIFLNVCACYF